jgi:hypothetical protein
MSKIETEFIDRHISKLLSKGAVEQCSPCQGQYISNVFLRPKKDGSYRMILNLKELNEYVVYHKFKMETLESIIKLVRPNCYMSSIDLKDAFYSVPIAPEHKKYLRFFWNDTLYQFTCLPFGLTSAPRKFTKLLKPVMAHLRLGGHTCAIYIDDTFLQGLSAAECRDNVQATKALLLDLGFTINESKSVLIPSTELVMLGFRINSMNMTVTLTKHKADASSISSIYGVCNRRKGIGAKIHFHTFLTSRRTSSVWCQAGVKP